MILYSKCIFRLNLKYLSRCCPERPGEVIHPMADSAGKKQSQEMVDSSAGVQEVQENMVEEALVKWDPQKVLKKTVTSAVWKFLYFTGSKQLPSKKRVFCKLCPEGSLVQAQGIPYSGSTTNLTNHMQSKHSEAFKIEIIAEQTQKNNLDSNQNKVDA